MPKGRQVFTDHVCESFQDDDEMALSAREQISTIVNDSNADLQHANENLTSGFFSRYRNRVVTTILLLLVGIGFITYHFRNIDKLRVFNSHDIFFTPEYSSLADRYTHLNDEEKFILFGDPDANTQLEVAESRLNRYPSNASYYIEYLGVFNAFNDKYPEDMVAHGDSIDPRNSLYRLCAIGKMTDRDKKVIIDKRDIDPYENETLEERKARIKKKRAERRNRGARNRKSKESDEKSSSSKTGVAAVRKPVKPRMVIVDEAKYKNALELFYEAADKEYFSEHINTLMKERIPLLNTELETLEDHMIPFLYMAHTSSPMLTMMRSADLVITEAQRCERDKDADSLKRLIQAHEKISRQIMAEDNVTLIHALVARAYIHRLLPHFRDAATACGLSELEQKYTDLFDAFERDKSIRESAPISAQIIDFQKNGSAISSIVTPLVYSKVREQSVISPIDHEPLRMVEHAIFSRVYVVFGWLFFIVIALLFFVANRYKNKLTRTISKELLGVFGVKDWLLVLLLGIVLPMLSFYCLDRFSPWSITAYNVVYVEGMHSILRASILVVILLCSQALVLEWRIGVVTNKVFGKQNVWLVWAALILAIVPIFMVNTIADSSDPLKWYVTLGLSLFLLITFIFLRFLPGLFSYKNSVLSRAIVFSLVMTATLITLLIPVYKAEERHWIAKDELMKLSPDRASFSKLEGDVTNQFMKETRELMDGKMP